MAWSASKVFVRYVKDSLDLTATLDIDTNAHKVVLYDNSITPDNTVSSAASGYTGGIWTATGSGSGTAQVYQAGQWAQGGVALASLTFAVSTATVTFDAADTASGAAATLSNVYGAYIYNDTSSSPVADQGVCYNYFGGINSVTAGTLTVVWNASGIAAFAC